MYYVLFHLMQYILECNNISFYNLMATSKLCVCSHCGFLCGTIVIVGKTLNMKYRCVNMEEVQTRV